MLKRSLWCSLLTTLLLAGCSSTKVDPYQGDPPEYIYAKGHTALQKGNNTDALAAYQSLDSQYPFNPLTQKGDLESIYAYYDNSSPAMAVTTASRYTKIYPSGPNLDYAYYMMGVVDFENGRGFLQKYFPYDMSKHHADNYTNAYNYFNTVVTSYASSPYANDARRRMIYLNNTLAQYQMNVADFDFQKKAYVAAINRAQDVIIHFPTTPQSRAALVMMLNSYQALGMTDLATSTQSVLALNQTNSVTTNS